MKQTRFTKVLALTLVLLMVMSSTVFGVTGRVISNKLTATITVTASNTAKVTNQTELENALADPTKSTIQLMNDFSTTKEIVIGRPVTIDGNSKAISYTGDTAGWQGDYVLHTYKTLGVNISNIKLTGADAGLLVNGSEVTLTGTINVTGNEFGGIESSIGVGVTTTPKLTVTGVTSFINNSEVYSLPTVWEDKITDTVIYNVGQFTLNSTVKANQVQYYIEASHAVDPNLAEVIDEAELIAALADSTKSTIKLMNDISTTEEIVIGRPVTIDGNSKAITYTGDAVGWQGDYVLHAYKTLGVNISNVKLTGADAGLLVNGSEVTLTGTINVSDNEFGGIESSLGQNVTTSLNLDVTGATLINNSETYSLPTIWEDKVTDTIDYVTGQFTLNPDVKAGQVQYYVVSGNAVNPVDYVTLSGTINGSSFASTSNINVSQGDNVAIVVDISVNYPNLFSTAKLVIEVDNTIVHEFSINNTIENQQTNYTYNASTTGAKTVEIYVVE